MPFVAVARLMTAVPLPVPDILHHSDALGIIGLQDLGDVTLQAHLGAATPDEHAALYREAVSFIARLQQRGAELASDDYPPYRIAFDTDKLGVGARVLLQVLRQGLSRRVARRGGAASALGGVVGDHPGAGGRAARAVPSRLSQPQPDAARRLALHHRLPGCADGAGHLRPGVAAPRLVRRSHVAAGRRADRLFPGAAGRPGRASRQDEAASSARRFDVMALQRNLKALGTFGYQTVTRGNSVYIQYMPRTLDLRARQPREVPAVRPSSRAAGRLHPRAPVNVRASA